MHCCVPVQLEVEMSATHNIQHVWPSTVASSHSQYLVQSAASSVESWLHVIWHE